MPKNVRRGRWLLLGTAVAVVAAACGSDEGEPTDDGEVGSTTGGATDGGKAAGGKAVGGKAGEAAGGGGGVPEGGRAAFECEVPGEVPEVDEASGIVKCDDVWYRPFVGNGCPYDPSLSTQGGMPTRGEGGAGGNAVDDGECHPGDCTTGVRPFCHEYTGQGGATQKYCLRGCLTDDDCNPNQICVCEDPRYGGRCVDSECASNAECDDGEPCASKAGCNYFACGYLDCEGP